MEGKKNANTNVFELCAIKIISPLHYDLTTPAISFFYEITHFDPFLTR